MIVIKWLIRFIIWFITSLFVLSLIGRMINIGQVSFYCDGHEQIVIPGNVVAGYGILISSFVIAFCIAFTSKIWKSVKIMFLFYAIPFVVFYFMKLINILIGLTGLSDLPLINFHSEQFTIAFGIAFISYIIIYGFVRSATDDIGRW